jgi:hypothetical protein
LRHRNRARIERDVLISMGGITAEARFTGLRNYDAARSDMENANQVASYLPYPMMSRP